MRIRRNDSLFPLMVAVFFAAAIWAVGVSANAAAPAESSAAKEEVKDEPEPMEYVVKPGDTMGGIAAAHGVTISALAEANGIDNPDQLFAGKKLFLPSDSLEGVVTKAGVVIRVPKGFSLSRIAAVYKIPVKAIARSNGIDRPNQVREGQKILIPGAKAVKRLVLPPPCLKAPVTLYRVRTDVSAAVSLCFCDGRPNPQGVKELSEFSGPIGMQMPFSLHPRLAQLLQRVAENYKGKRLEIVSGQRVSKQPDRESYHTKGQAIDFRVAGVKNKSLTQFIRKFDRVGVGFYPNSVFVHMDTRDDNAYWIDYSAPGEGPIYGPAGMPEEKIEAIRTERKEKQVEQVAHKAEVESVESSAPAVEASVVEEKEGTADPEA